ncbi:MAG: SUMF1/EgtB/PvdO family nonheme iron enzyme [Treponema sp.]|nr:SUMF1/EgtB/PvdO family nonheme iron enzyme [Treponema sp.]
MKRNNRQCIILAVLFYGLFFTVFAGAQVRNFSQRGRATQELQDNRFVIAHPSLPLNYKVMVENTTTGNSIEVIVIGRILASTDRIADLSAAVWQRLGLSPGTDIRIFTADTVQQETSLSEMVRINGGAFTMGSPASEPERGRDETPHRVTVSSFYMGKYQVTQKDYEEIMGTNPSRFKGPNLPVEMVSWYDAVEYCNKRSQKEGLSPAYTINSRTPAAGYPITNARVSLNRNATGYRLPTEAEWEYASRAGTATPFSTGNNITTSQANYNGYHPYNNNAKGTNREKTTDVGSFAPNPWGLYDMHGNVWEWCWDWYASYPSRVQTNPLGPASGTLRVFRGGSWGSAGHYLRSDCRFGINPFYHLSIIGFRVVRS